MNLLLYLLSFAFLIVAITKGKDILIYYTAVQEAKNLQPAFIGKLTGGDCRIKNTLEAINKNLFIVVGENNFGKHVWAVDNPYLANLRERVVDKTTGLEKEKVLYNAYAIYKLDKNCNLKRVATIKDDPDMLYINELYISTFCKKVKEKENEKNI